MCKNTVTFVKIWQRSMIFLVHFFSDKPCDKNPNPCYTIPMSTHINAPDGAIAPNVLLPGDPLRAKFIAEHFLENAKCYNEVRGMFGVDRKSVG